MNQTRSQVIRQEAIQQWLREQGSPLEVTRYVNSEDMDVKCALCGYTAMRPTRLLRTKAKGNCPECQPVAMGRKLSTDAKDKVLQACAERGYTMKGYIGTNKYASFKCRHGHRWSTYPTVITSGSGCPECAVKYSYSYRKVRLGKRTFEVQGFEDLALVSLTQEASVDVRRIQHGRSEVKTFTYMHKGQKRRYYPDFQIGNTIVEIKSMYTAGLLPSIGLAQPPSFAALKKKARAVEAQGFKFKLMFFHVERGEVCRGRVPEDWTQLSKSDMLLSIDWTDITHLEGVRNAR